MKTLKSHIGWIVAVLLNVAGLLWLGGKNSQVVAEHGTRLDRQDKRIEAVEVKLEAQGGDLREIKTHVEWIRRTMERKGP